jgi:hypothetical protein
VRQQAPASARKVVVPALPASASSSYSVDAVLALSFFASFSFETLKSKEMVGNSNFKNEAGTLSYYRQPLA